MARPRRFDLREAMEGLLVVAKAVEDFDDGLYAYDHGQYDFAALRADAQTLDAMCDELRGRLKEASEVARLAVRREEEKRREKRAAPTRPREV